MKLTKILNLLLNDKVEDNFNCESTIKALQKAIEPEITKLLKDTGFIESIKKNKSISEGRESFLNAQIKVNLSLKEVGKIIRYLEKGLERYAFKNLLLYHSNVMKKAHEAYLSADRQDKGLREAAKILGLTNSKRREKFNKSAILWEYIGLITGKADLETFKVNPPMEKWEAIEFLTKRHGIQSKKACYKLLQRAISEKKKKVEAEGLSSNGWKGLLPWDGDN